MQKFFTKSNKEVYYQPLQSMINDFDSTPEESLKEVRTLIKLAAKKYSTHIVISEFTYNEIDNILVTDISISGDDETNCSYTLNYLRDSIRELSPYVEFLKEYKEKNLRALRIDWNFKEL